jgi:hypothetical protein
MLSARLFFAIAGALALATTVGAPVSAVAPLGGVASALPSAPVILPTPALGTCGPVGSGPGEIDGVIKDTNIGTHADLIHDPVFAKSTAIAFPQQADPGNQFYNAMVTATGASYTQALAAKNIKDPSTGATFLPAEAPSAQALTVYAMQQYGGAQATLTGAYANVGTQAVSAALAPSPRSTKLAEFTCRGLAILVNPKIPSVDITYEMVVTELFTDPGTGAVITRYYEGLGVAVPTVVSGLPTVYTVLKCIGSVPYSIDTPSDNCPTK